MDAVSALKEAVNFCKWIIDQRAVNNEAQKNLHDLRTSIEDILPVLEAIKEDDPTLKSAERIFASLWQCLQDAKHIYLKYMNGWSIRKPFVTPAHIKGKAAYHKDKVQGVISQLQLALVTSHRDMTESSSEIIIGKLNELNRKLDQNVANHTKMVNQDRKFLEIEGCEIDFPRNLTTNGLPQTVLGQGTFGVVGLGYYTGPTKDGPVERIPVAIKMVGANLVSVVQDDPTGKMLQEFKNEVKFMCSIDHPNICESYGAITRQEGHLLLWLVMEKLDVNLRQAIKTGLLKHGRDAPKIFTGVVAGIASAVAYLHTPPINGKPS
jgi:hypothetical protein